MVILCDSSSKNTVDLLHFSDGGNSSGTNYLDRQTLHPLDLHHLYN